MSRLAGINENDVINGEGVCVSVFLQGCPYHCKGCHNPETWNFNGGKEITDEKTFIANIESLLFANNITRNLSILGGEPLCKENIELTYKIISYIKKKHPEIQTFVWTGATLNELKEMYDKQFLNKVLLYIDTLITGRFEIDQRDVSLHLRGSRNQEVLKRFVDF